MARTATKRKLSMATTDEERKAPAPLPDPTPEELKHLAEQVQVIKAAKVIVDPILHKLSLWRQADVDLDHFSADALWARATWLYQVREALQEADMDEQYGFGLDSAIRAVNDELVRHQVANYPRQKLSTDRLKCYKCGSEHIVRLRAPYKYDDYHSQRRPYVPDPHFVADLQCRACKAKSHIHELRQLDQYIRRPGKSEQGGGTCFLCGVETSDYESTQALAQSFVRDTRNERL